MWFHAVIARCAFYINCNVSPSNPLFFWLNLLLPIADAHIQRTGLIQMEIGIDAVPAVLFCRAAPWRKGGTALSGPDIATYVRDKQRPVFPPLGGLAHNKAFLSLSQFSWREDSIIKKGTPDLCLKGAIFCLVLSHFRGYCQELCAKRNAVFIGKRLARSGRLLLSRNDYNTKNTHTRTALQKNAPTLENLRNGACKARPISLLQKRYPQYIFLNVDDALVSPTDFSPVKRLISIGNYGVDGGMFRTPA